jgi:aldehyde dehydrogenase (NAD+)
VVDWWRGGARPDNLDRGWYDLPTVVDVDDHANPLAEREVFGPVITVQVNTSAATSFTAMGGYKQSGIGRERGVAGAREFQELKHIVVGSR